MARLILTAENFAFGPIGKLLDVADELPDQGHELVFAGFGTSLQLAKHFPFKEIHEVDTDNPESVPTLEKLIGQADMLISSMDIPSVVVAERLSKLTTWIDCLFWFWDSIPNSVLNVDLYIKERFMDDSANEKKYATQIKNLQNVGPIIGRVEGGQRKNQALISYGGGEASYWYQAGRDTNYPVVMTEILLKSVDWSQFDRVILATSERIAKELAQKFPDSPFEITTLAHNKFIQELSSSDILLSIPGLATTELSFAFGTPTIFLPPSNNSQYLQLDQFLQKGVAPAHAHLSEFMPKLPLSGIPVHDSTKLILNQLRELERSPEIQNQIGRRINQLLQNRKRWANEFVSKGKIYFDSLGGNGAKTVAKKIDQLLVKNGLNLASQPPRRPLGGYL